jgi:hypothetical protein
MMLPKTKPADEIPLVPFTAFRKAAPKVLPIPRENPTDS